MWSFPCFVLFIDRINKTVRNVCIVVILHVKATALQVMLSIGVIFTYKYFQVPLEVSHELFECFSFEMAGRVLCLLLVISLASSFARYFTEDEYFDIDKEIYRFSIKNSTKYIPFISEPTFVVPSPNLPSQVQPQTSNNCVGILLFQNRLFLGWR